jgi:hypothetical protein
LADAITTKQFTFKLSAEEFDIFANGLVDMIKNEVEGYSFYNGHHILPLEVMQKIQDKFVSIPPNTWIKIELIGEQEKSCSLFLRGDNLYLVAFATEAGQIYYMGDYAQVFGEDAKRLNFGEEHRAIFAGGDLDADVPKLMSEVVIGKSQAQAQSTILADYDPAKDSDEVLQKALAPLIIMFSEGMRLKPIADRCRQHWKVSGRITEDEAKLTKIWGPGSYVWCSEEQDPSKWTPNRRKALRKSGKIKTYAGIEPMLFMVKRPVTPTKGCPPAASSPTPSIVPALA